MFKNRVKLKRINNLWFFHKYSRWDSPETCDGFVKTMTVPQNVRHVTNFVETTSRNMEEVPQEVVSPEGSVGISGYAVINVYCKDKFRLLSEGEMQTLWKPERSRLRGNFEFLIIVEELPMNRCMVIWNHGDIRVSSSPYIDLWLTFDMQVIISTLVWVVSRWTDLWLVFGVLVVRFLSFHFLCDVKLWSHL